MNLFKNITISFALLFVASCVFGQETQEKAKRVISLNMYKSIVYNGGASGSTSTIGLGNFTPSVAWGIENEDFNEIEITELDFSNRTSSFNLTIGAQYTYNWQLVDLKSEKASFYIGTGFGADVFTANNRAVTTVDFTVKHTDVSLNLSISPLFRWNFSDRFFLNFSVPYQYYNYSYDYTDSDNPTIPMLERKQTKKSSKIFPNDFTVKIGVGLKF